MRSVVRGLRRLVSPVKHWAFPSPERRAWRHACRLAERVPRHRSGTIRLMGYEIEYADLLSTCPQWYDLFVERSLRFHSDSARPLVVDCGANIGLSVLAARRDHPECRVLAFEADPAISELLERNLERNAVTGVDVHHAAVWVDDGELSFRCEGSDSGAVDAVAGTTPGEVRSVPSIRLRDVLLREESIDMLKLDIEGAELEVMRDCADALGSVKALTLDLHEFDPRQRRTPEILTLLADAGFTYHQDALHPLPWRASVVGGEGATFPGAHLCWVSLVRAWRD